MLSHVPSTVVPGKRAKRARPGTHNHRQAFQDALERHRTRQQAPVVMGPGSRFAWPGRQRSSCLTCESGTTPSPVTYVSGTERRTCPASPVVTVPLRLRLRRTRFALRSGVAAPRVARRTKRGGEGVSQSPLKDKAFSTFLDRNPPFGLRRRKMRFRPGHNLFLQRPIIDENAIDSHVRVVSGAPFLRDIAAEWRAIAVLGRRSPHGELAAGRFCVLGLGARSGQLVMALWS